MSIVCKLFFIHYFFTLPLQYTVHRKSTVQLVQYYFLTDIGDQSTLSAIDSWMLCVLIVFVSPAFFFPLKNQPQYLIDFQVEKVLCCVVILLSVTRLSYQWRLNKNAFFSLFPARFMLRLHVLNLEVQECSRQHKIVLKICFIIN